MMTTRVYIYLTTMLLWKTSTPTGLSLDAASSRRKEIRDEQRSSTYPILNLMIPTNVIKMQHPYQNPLIESKVGLIRDLAELANAEPAIPSLRFGRQLAFDSKTPQSVKRVIRHGLQNGKKALFNE